MGVLHTYCIGEHEEASPWPPLHVERGFAPGDSTVAVFAGEAPHGVYDHRSRRGRQILNSIAVSLAATWNYKLTGYGDTLVVLSPEHARTLAEDGWDKPRIRLYLWERCQLPVRELIPHPIQPLLRDEVRVLADKAWDEIQARLVRG